jgi:hypothetical protein
LLCPQEFGWSPELSFVAPPAPGANQTVRLLAIADLGQAELDGSMEMSEMLPSLATTARLAAEVDAGAQLLLHNGDISCEHAWGRACTTCKRGSQPSFSPACSLLTCWQLGATCTQQKRRPLRLATC